MKAHIELGRCQGFANCVLEADFSDCWDEAVRNFSILIWYSRRKS